MSAKCFTVTYDRSDILGHRSNSKIVSQRCIARLGALYFFNHTLQVEEFTHRTIVAIKQSRYVPFYIFIYHIV